MIFAQAVIIVFSLIIFLKLPFIKSAYYEFIAGNDEIFEPCSYIPNNNGHHDLFDMSDFVIEYLDGEVNAQGNVTSVWNVNPTDRVQLRVEVYKYQRSAWQLTPYSMLVKDFCNEFFKKDSIWYNFWTHAVHESDRICLNNMGHIYHHDYFNANTSMQMVHNIEGRYKIVIMFEAFDENNIMNPSTICTEVPGDIVKL